MEMIQVAWMGYCTKSGKTVERTNNIHIHHTSGQIWSKEFKRVKYGQKEINMTKKIQKGPPGQRPILNMNTEVSRHINRILFMIRSNKNPIKSALSVS